MKPMLTYLLKWKSEHLPLDAPEVDLPSLAEDPEFVAASFDAIEASLDDWRSEQNNRFEAAMVRIRLCAFLHGAKYAFSPMSHALDEHYPWCPSEAWQNAKWGIRWHVPVHG